MKKFSKLFLGLAIGALSLGLASCSKDEADSVPTTNVSVPSVPDTTPTSTPNHTEGGSESIVEPTPTPSVPINPDNRPKFDDVRFDNDGAPLIKNINVEMYDYKKDINLSDEKAMYLGFQDFLKSIIDGQVFLSGYSHDDNLLREYVPTVGFMSFEVTPLCLDSIFATGSYVRAKIYDGDIYWNYIKTDNDSKLGLLEEYTLPKGAKKPAYVEAKLDSYDALAFGAEIVDGGEFDTNYLLKAYNAFKYGEDSSIGYLSYAEGEFTLDIYDRRTNNLRLTVKTDAYTYLNVYVNTEYNGIILSEEYIINNNDNLSLVMNSLSKLNEAKVRFDYSEDFKRRDAVREKLNAYLGGLDQKDKEFAIENVAFLKRRFDADISSGEIYVYLEGFAYFTNSIEDARIPYGLSKSFLISDITKKVEGSKTIYSYELDESESKISFSYTLENGLYEAKLIVIDPYRSSQGDESFDCKLAITERGTIDEYFNIEITEPVCIEKTFENVRIKVSDNYTLVSDSISQTSIIYSSLLGDFMDYMEVK